MNLEFTVIVVGLTLFLALYAALAMVFRRKIDSDKRLRGASSSEEEKGIDWRAALSRLEGLFKPLGEILPKSPEDMSNQEKRLAQAGIRRKDAVILFRGAQVGLALAIFFGISVSGNLYKNIIVSFVGSAFFGAVLPDLWLKHSTSKRKEQIRCALPDALDLAASRTCSSCRRA